MVKILMLLSLVMDAYAKISDCSVNSIFKSIEQRLTPDPPVPGENVTLYLRFNNPGLPVSDGTETTQTSFNYIPMSPTTKPLCDCISCPIQNTIIELTSTSEWPRDLPRGLIITTITWTNANDEQLLCTKLSITTKDHDYLEGF